MLCCKPSSITISSLSARASSRMSQREPFIRLSRFCLHIAQGLDCCRQKPKKSLESSPGYVPRRARLVPLLPNPVLDSLAWCHSLWPLSSCTTALIVVQQLQGGQFDISAFLTRTPLITLGATPWPEIPWPTALAFLAASFFSLLAAQCSTLHSDPLSMGIRAPEPLSFSPPAPTCWLCVEVGLVKRVHTLFVRNAQQVVYELQVREEVEGVRQEVREVKGESKVEESRSLHERMWMRWMTNTRLTT